MHPKCHVLLTIKWTKKFTTDYILSGSRLLHVNVLYCYWSEERRLYPLQLWLFCFKLTVVIVSLFVYSQLDITHARSMSYNYSDLQRVLEALIQMTKARLQESEVYNMRHSSEVDAFKIKKVFTNNNIGTAISQAQVCKTSPFVMLECWQGIIDSYKRRLHVTRHLAKFITGPKIFCTQSVVWTALVTLQTTELFYNIGIVFAITHNKANYN